MILTLICNFYLEYFQFLQKKHDLLILFYSPIFNTLQQMKNSYT